MEPDEELTDEETDDLVAWGDRMDGNYQPPILAEPTGGPIPEPDPTLDEIHAMAAEEPFPAAAARARELALLGVTRAAGHDVTPGHDELHHYWTRGEGLAKWAESPKPWTTLVAHLTKYVGLRKAKIFASRWFIEVFGFAAGSDLNRVTHGKPPRGKRVGPG